MKIPLFVYWEGPLPRHIDLCIASVIRTAPPCECHLVTPNNLQRYVPSGTLHANMTKLREPAHRADAIRAALMALHGGFYFDADTIGLRSPEPIASDHDLVYSVWNNRPRRVLNGYVYCRPGSSVARGWLEHVNRVLSESGSGKLPWTALGEGVLTRLVDENPDTTRRIDRSIWLPIDVDSEVRRFFTSGNPAEIETPETVCWGLNHSWMMHNHRIAMTRSDDFMKKSPLLIHRLFSRAIRACTSPA